MPTHPAGAVGGEGRPAVVQIVLAPVSADGGARSSARPASVSGSRHPTAPHGTAHAPGVHRTGVVLIDDHRAFTDALAMAIDHQADLHCLGTPSTIAEATATLETARPDVVLVDIFLPDGDGIDAISRLRDRVPNARFVVMTGYTDVDVLARAASAGASGFLPKETPMGSVLAAIRAAGDGRMLVDGSTLAAILGRERAPSPERRTAAPPQVGLTAREQDVLQLMREGLDPHTIAQRLGISFNTCRGYEKAILAKLNAHSQLEAVVMAARLGLVDRLDR